MYFRRPPSSNALCDEDSIHWYNTRNSFGGALEVALGGRSYPFQTYGSSNTAAVPLQTGPKAWIRLVRAQCRCNRWVSASWF